MTTPDNLLRRLLAITEDTPFQGTMAALTDVRESSVSGTIMFRLQEGRLRYEFFVAPETCDHELLRILSHDEGKLTLEVPDLGFKRRAINTTIPSMGLVDPYQALRGQVESDYFGDAEAALSGATLYLLNLPGEHWGAGNTSHWSYVERDGEKNPRPCGPIELPGPERRWMENKSPGNT